MKIVSALALVIAVGGISGCASKSESQLRSIPLNATLYNPGHNAQVTLAPMGNQTVLWLFISGVPLGTASPVRLYTYLYLGSCAGLGPKPVYDLNQSVNTQFYLSESGIRGNRDIHLRKSVPLGYDALRSGGYALVVRGSPADGGHDIFCGNLN
jgi:hypothetical protein